MSASSRQETTDKDSSVAELRQRIGELEAMLVRAQRLAAMGTMAAMVAHEFNNILTPVMNYAQMALDGDEALRGQAIRQALEGGGRAAAISRAILDFVGREGDAPQTVAMSELVDQTLLAMARDFSRDGIRLIRRIPPRLKLSVRPAELKQVLLNLLLNARSAVMKKGRRQSIVISARRSGSELLVRVADTGVGIRRERLGNIFEPFYSGNGGTGLGLAVCKHLVTNMSGRLTVRSQVGKGTIFTVALPVGALAPAHARRPAVALAG